MSSFHRVVVAAAVAGGFTAFGNAAIVKVLNLDNHPDGSVSPPPYGLRLDNVLEPGVATFEIQSGTLTVEDNAGDLSIVIDVRLFGGTLDGNGGYTNGAFYDIVYSYTEGVEATATGWRVVGEHAVNGGTLIEDGGDNTQVVLGSKAANGVVFYIQADGHRLSGDNTTWVGRGWVTPPAAGFQDWLFTGVDTGIPTPGSAALIGVAGLVAVRRKRG
ncbi:MAG: hypothetical protein AAGB34_03530 [Planctomycetota bacterium]